MVSSPDGAIVVDLQGLFQIGRKGFLVKFDTIGAEMWKLVAAGKTDPEVVDGILQEYAVDRETVEHDLAGIIREANAMGLRRDAQILNPDQWADTTQTLPFFPWYGQDATASANDARHKPSRWMVLCAFLVLGLFDRVLARISMRLMCSTVRRWPVRHRNITEDIGTLLGKLCSAVDRACIWYGLTRKTCLPRSATTTVMFRLWGVAGKMVLATRVMPIYPHSYARVGGSVINDYPTVKSFYQTIVSF
jgi:hypothetical protein